MSPIIDLESDVGSLLDKLHIDRYYTNSTGIDDKTANASQLKGRLILTLIASLSPILFRFIPVFLTAMQLWTMRMQLLKVEPLYWSILLAGYIYVVYLAVDLFNHDQTGGTIAVLAASIAAALYSLFRSFEACLSFKRARLLRLAWTNASRSGIPYQTAMRFSAPFAARRGTARRLGTLSRVKNVAKRHSVEYSFLFWQANSHDITDTATYFQSLSNDGERLDMDNSMRGYAIQEGREHPSSLSILWGPASQYAPRVSRAITSCLWDEVKFQKMASCLGSREELAKGVALGILGRNKGVHAGDLQCGLFHEQEEGRNACRSLERLSMLAPRPAKTHQGAVFVEMKDRFSSLGDDYVGAATDLCLALIDTSTDWTTRWLSCGMEHQIAHLAWDVAQCTSSTSAFLKALYDSHYASMLSSIHMGSDSYRPDFVCAAVLLESKRELDDFMRTATMNFRRLAFEEMRLFSMKLDSREDELRAFQIIACVLLGQDGTQVYPHLPSWRHALMMQQIRP